ncbi:hypothetical protein [Stratiformator vulcanicus]|uniref:Uncharacterized protein n=1 Tax=Stratiformator vulcanicus TaxID=2527980 RepID=A0A517R160_9PLAN|nr:hypothetical protein [Stratiformator vulcanicus]QDT37635.1 hypothetical protein Pan189_20150 [Stratiformator vulcanicus]
MSEPTGGDDPKNFGFIRRYSLVACMTVGAVGFLGGLVFILPDERAILSGFFMLASAVAFGSAAIASRIRWPITMTDESPAVEEKRSTASKFSIRACLVVGTLSVVIGITMLSANPAIFSGQLIASALCFCAAPLAFGLVAIATRLN